MQQLGAGVAAWIGGMLLNTTEGAEANGPLIGYPTVGLVAAAAAVVSVFLAGWLRPAPGGASAPDAEAVEATHHHFAKKCVKEAVTCSEGASTH